MLCTRFKHTWIQRDMRTLHRKCTFVLQPPSQWMVQWEYAYVVFFFFGGRGGRALFHIAYLLHS